MYYDGPSGLCVLYYNDQHEHSPHVALLCLVVSLQPPLAVGTGT